MMALVFNTHNTVVRTQPVATENSFLLLYLPLFLLSLAAWGIILFMRNIEAGKFRSSIIRLIYLRSLVLIKESTNAEELKLAAKYQTDGYALLDTKSLLKMCFMFWKPLEVSVWFPTLDLEMPSEKTKRTP